MSDYLFPAAYALFLWWFSTGAVLYLDGLPSFTFRKTMTVATVVFLAALAGIAFSDDDDTISGAYASFTFGFFAWAWQEISFYLGYVTGPRRVACPEGCRGWPHLRHAVMVTLHHEIKIILTVVVILALTHGAEHRLALWSFLILWAMHQSARLNVFLGVPNLSEEFLPDHLRYLRSFLNRRPMNMLFPLSVTVTTVAATWVIGLAIAAETGGYDQTTLTFLATLLVIGVIEHWFLVLPLPTTALWTWGMKSHHRAADGSPILPITPPAGPHE